jgi:hypothetical protein
MFRRLLLLVLMPAVLIVAGCGDDDDNPLGPGPTTRTLISNLSGAENASIPLDSGRVAAVGFTMPDTSYLLNFIRLKLEMDPGEADSVTVRLYNNVAGSPGTLILTFNDPLVPVQSGDPEVTVFSPPVIYTLAADSTYWLVVHNAGSGSVGWTTGSPSLIPTGDATHFGAKIDTGVLPGVPTTDTATIGQYAVTGTRL